MPPNLGTSTAFPGVRASILQGIAPSRFVSGRGGDHESILNENVGGFAAAYNSGVGVTGGAGFPIVTVTNTNNSGSGSLRAAIDGGGNRWIRFSQGLGGTIDISSSIVMNSSNVTLDGRGANVTIKASTYGLCTTNSSVSNFIIMYLKISGAERDNINIDYAKNFWIYHLSLSNAGDGCLDIRKTDGHFTIQETHFFNSSQGMLFF